MQSLKHTIENFVREANQLAHDYDCSLEVKIYDEHAVIKLIDHDGVSDPSNTVHLTYKADMPYNCNWVIYGEDRPHAMIKTASDLFRLMYS